MEPQGRALQAGRGGADFNDRSSMSDTRPDNGPPERLRGAPKAASVPLASGFGPTVFDSIGLDLPPVTTKGAAPGSAFDVCHVGVVLRTLLFVHGTVAAVLLFIADDPAGWLMLAAVAASIALPAVLLWLVLACGLERWLAGWRPLAQSGAGAVLGAFSAIAASTPAWLLNGDTIGLPRWTALGCAGAGMAVVVTRWLQLRVQATLPAATTARLAELQSRIRPHFLFNTLNTALTLVRLDPARAEGLLEDLAELFRVAISESSESVTLDEEVELARRYIAIEQIRFGARLTVSWDLDPAAGLARVPPLLLQPLVENAVRHGVEPADEGGVIRIRTRVRHGRAVVSIVNTLPARPSTPGHGMALRNVRERLRLMHDVAAHLDTREDAEVFRVQVVVPL